MIKPFYSLIKTGVTFKIDKQNKNKLDLLFYEVKMFNLVFDKGFPDDQVELNARLESFLVHARILIDFLENKKKEDDIVCDDFLCQSSSPISKIRVNLDTNTKYRINKHLQHITEVRVFEKPRWAIDLIRGEINKSLGHFFLQLSSEYFPTESGRQRGDFLYFINN